MPIVRRETKRMRVIVLSFKTSGQSAVKRTLKTAYRTRRSKALIKKGNPARIVQGYNFKNKLSLRKR